MVPNIVPARVSLPVSLSSPRVANPKSIKVTLHPSFAVPELVLKLPPYEHQTSGWGAFPIEMQMNFKQSYYTFKTQIFH